MDEFTFKPKYGFKNVLGAVFILLLGVFLIYQGYKDNTFMLLVGGVFLVLLGIFSYIAYPREIVFTQNQVKVKKFLFPEQTFEYQDFTDIGGTGIRFGRKGITLLNMKNGSELVSIFQKIIDERKIHPSQVEGKLIVEEALTQRALKISIIPTILGGLGLSFLLSGVFNLNLDGRLTFLVSFLIIFPGTYYILKHRQESE